MLQLSREAFLTEFWRYEPGEHVLIVEPTGGGKTHLAYQLLGETMRQHPDLSVVSLMPKPVDPSTVTWARALDLRETPTWPPVRKLLSGKPSGYVLWPRHRMDVPPEQRREFIGQVLRKGIDSQYRKGKSITLVDDAHSSAAMMGLNTYIEELLVNGRANEAGAWLALQKPSGSLASGGITSFAYSSATHLFLGRDNDERNIRRFSEIGGIDPREVASIVRDLRLYRIGNHTVSEKLYIDQRGPYKALIGP